VGAIAGWIAGRNAPDEAALLPALEALAHRGASGERLFAYRTDNGQRVVLGQPWFDEASGIAVALDGALAKLGHNAYGPALLGIVAAGLVGFAAYSVLDARYRKV